MPAKSKAQIGKLFVLEKEGKLPKGEAKKWVKETPNHGRDLPQHVGDKKKTKKAKPKRKR